MAEKLPMDGGQRPAEKPFELQPQQRWLRIGFAGTSQHSVDVVLADLDLKLLSSKPTTVVLPFHTKAIAWQRNEPDLDLRFKVWIEIVRP